MRFTESAAIAEHAERLGVRLSPIADDLMSLWYDELDLAWRKAPMALGGVTLADALFVLETFARDRDMHVVYRGEHGLVEKDASHTAWPGLRAASNDCRPCRRRGNRRWRRRLTECPLGTPPIAQCRTRHRRRRAIVA